MLPRLKLFFVMKRRLKMLYIEAFLQLGYARILKSLPFGKVAPLLGIYMKETKRNDEYNRIVISEVSQAIHIMSKYTLWESQCLVKAIAAMRMLHKRGIDSTLYLGTAKDEKGSMIAHAWLRSGPYYVTGVEEMKRFTIVSTFAKQVH